MRLLPKRASQPLGGLGAPRAQRLLRRRLQVVAAEAVRCRSRSARGCVCKKAREYNSFGLADQQPGWRRSPRVATARGGLDHGQPLRAAACERRQPLADAFDEGVVPADEERHVGAQRQRPAPAAARAASAGPTAGSAPAGWWPRPSCRRPGRRPRARACRSRCRRRARVPLSACSARAARRHRSSAGSGGAQVVARQRAVAAPLEVQRVAPVDQHEHRLQQVIAVGAAADHVQEQVQLGRRRHVVTAPAASWCAVQLRAQPHHRAAPARRASDVARCRSVPGRRASPAARSRSRARIGRAGSPRRARAGRAASRTRRAAASVSPKTSRVKRVQVGEAASRPAA